MSDDQTPAAAPDETVEEPVAPKTRAKPNPTAEVAPVQSSAPTAYAVVQTGGKQYRVKVGDRIRVEKLDGGAGSDITLDRVLLVGGDGGTRVGLPVVDGATVTARIEGQERGQKLVVFKYKAKKGYRRRIGHRQSLTQLTVTAING